MYRILWFDDEHETSQLIKDDFLLEDILLIGISNSKQGLKELKDNYKNYQGVLLDGLFFNDPEDKGNALDDEAYGAVAKALSELKAKGNIIPWFTYSGQKNFVKDKNKVWSILKDIEFAEGKVFDKNKDQDLLELCMEIKKAADAQPELQARHNNSEIFQIFELGYLSEKVEEQVLNLIIADAPKNLSEIKGILANIRSIHESCFNKLEQLKIIPNANDKISSILYHLSGRPNRSKDYEPDGFEYITRDIKNLHEWIYYTCGTFIHNLKNSEHDYQISNYAVQSLISGILEILLWFKKTYQENI